MRTAPARSTPRASPAGCACTAAGTQRAIVTTARQPVIEDFARIAASFWLSAPGEPTVDFAANDCNEAARAVSGEKAMSANGESYDGRMIRALVCLMFFTFAMTTDAVGSVIPAVIAEFSLSMTAASAFQYATMAGIAAGALLLGFLADRLGRKPTVIVGLVLYGPASLVFAVSERFGAFVILLALSGSGISVFKIGALALVGDLSESTTSHTRFMNTIE